MTIFQALILSVVEGLTEFLPVSSTGHLILTSFALDISQTEFVKTFEIFIQFGAILAVIVLYGKSYLKNLKVLRKVFLAFLPTGILGLLFYPIVKNILLGNPYITLAALFIGGLFLIFIEKLPFEKNAKTDEIAELTDRQSLSIGIFQAFSMIPGLSRAAATIIGGLVMGLKRKPAVEFSFLLAVPTIFAASTYDLYKTGISFTQSEWTLLSVGFIASFIVSIFAIKFFIALVKHHTLAVFGYYRIALAILYAMVFLH